MSRAASSGGGAVHLPLCLDGSDAPVCEVWVGRDVLSLSEPAVLDALRVWLHGRTLFVVSSPQILGLHAARLEPLRALAERTVFLSVPDGEKAKSLAYADELWQSMLEAGGKRDSRLVAFGGGSVGDLGGFVAACFLRGIEFAQVPTTLLAQVDASIGGKTAVDMPQGKNFVGAFHQPRFVLTDTSLLSTLPGGELRAGLVEAVKKAALLDGALLARMEKDLEALLRGDGEVLAPVVAGAVRLKLDVVARDETEAGLRKVLNFGHTLAHAVEQQLGYRGLRHGEAVAYGILFAVRLAELRGLLQDDLGERLRRLFGRFELPPLPVDDLSMDGMLAAMAKDKKAGRSGLTWVLPSGLESYVFDSDVGTAQVESLLQRFLAQPWEAGG